VLVNDVSRRGLLERCLRVTVGTSIENERCVTAMRDGLRAIGSGGAEPPNDRILPEAADT
jgi:hypothetical protein